MKTERVGFTGTQLGMTPLQIRILRDILLTKHITEAHHGCCVGADAEFHWIIRNLETDRGVPVVIVGHRSTLFGKTDSWVVNNCDIKKNPLPPLERNSNIAEHAQWLIAAPKERAEIQRSGTWSTVRRARKRGIPICIIWPDGKVEWENNSDASTA